MNALRRYADVVRSHRNVKRSLRSVDRRRRRRVRRAVRRGVAVEDPRDAPLAVELSRHVQRALALPDFLQSRWARRIENTFAAALVAAALLLAAEDGPGAALGIAPLLGALIAFRLLERLSRRLRKRARLRAEAAEHANLERAGR